MPWYLWRPICWLLGHRWLPLVDGWSYCRCSRPLRVKGGL